MFGQMHNGKSTFSKALVEPLNAAMREDVILRHKYAFHVTSFAYALKRIVCGKYGISMEDIEKWKNEPVNFPGWNITMRECLQREGQLGRDVKPAVWIDRTIKSNYPVIIDDGRYINEAEALRAAGGFNILVVRPTHINDSEHPSEKDMGDLIKSMMNGHDHSRLFHGVVMNSGDAELLQRTAVAVVPQIINHFKNQSC